VGSSYYNNQEADRQTDFGVDGAQVSSTEDVLVVLECTAVESCTHEMVVGHTSIVTAADSGSGLGANVTTLAQQNTATINSIG